MDSTEVTESTLTLSVSQAWDMATAALVRVFYFLTFIYQYNQRAGVLFKIQ